MSGECGHHTCKKKKTLKWILFGSVSFSFTVSVTILIRWAILKPSKPTFILQEVTVYGFNATVPNFLTSNFQVTLSSLNPSGHTGIHYDCLEAYVTYRSQQVTLRTSIPPSYQGPNEVNVWSPFVCATNIPVSPYNFEGPCQDPCQHQTNGNVVVIVNVDGKARWKGGAFISGHYNLRVRCRALVTFGAHSTGIALGDNAVKYQLLQQCSVGV